MGTMINLALGRLEIDWGKNNFFRDHSALFQEDDIKPVPSYYAGPDWPEGEPIVEMHEGLGKPLRHVVDRIELLGYTLAAVEHHYGELRRLHGLNDDNPIPFAELRAALKNVDVTRVSGTYYNEYDPGEFFREEMVDRLSLEPRRHNYHLDSGRPDHRQIDLLLENFDPYGGLRLLAENPRNLELEANWDFGPLVESGWAEAGEFRPGLTREDRFLVVTEGRSDARILKHALSLTRPHVADFFQFIDMQEGYPFSGTGNLSKFARGLVSIGIQNSTVILYDNDTEGVRGYRMTQGLPLPPSMRVICLPRLESLAAVRTIGPTGETTEDINGRAAAIECYLDWSCSGVPEPVVRWTSFSEQSDSYQGHLLHKDRFARRFLEQRSQSGAALFRRVPSHSFIRSYGPGRPLGGALWPGQLPAGVSTRCFRAPVRPDRDRRHAFRSIASIAPPGHSRGVLLRCRGEGRRFCDGRSDDEFLGAGVQRAGDDADPRGRGGLCGVEPDGAGAHGVRAVGVAAPERAAEGSGVPGVSGAARRGGCAGAAGQAAGPRAGFGHPGSPDGGGRAGLPACGPRAGHRAAVGRAGVRAGRAPAVPGAGGALPLPGARGSLPVPTCAIWCSRRGRSGWWSAACSSRARRGAWRRGTAGWAGTMRRGRGISSTWSTTAASWCCRGSG